MRFERLEDGARFTAEYAVREVCVEKLEIHTFEERTARQIYFMQRFIGAILEELRPDQAQRVIDCASTECWEVRP